MIRYHLFLDGKLAAIVESPAPLGTDNEVRGIATARALRGELSINIAAADLRYCDVRQYDTHRAHGGVPPVHTVHPRRAHV